MAESFTRREVNRALLVTALAFASGGPAQQHRLYASAPLFDFAIAGGHHYGLESALLQLTPGTLLKLEREPDNLYDPLAVAVLRNDSLKLGFIPRSANMPIARMLDSGQAIQAEIVGMLNIHRADDIPENLVFTHFSSGDPLIRLTAIASEHKIFPL